MIYNTDKQSCVEIEENALGKDMAPEQLLTALSAALSAGMDTPANFVLDNMSKQMA